MGLLGVAFKLREFCLRHAELLARLGHLRARALDEPLAVSLQIEKAGDKLQSVRARRSDELGKFPLRERDALFKVALFQPYDALQKRVPIPDAVGEDEERIPLLFVHFERLRGVLAL